MTAFKRVQNFLRVMADIVAEGGASRAERLYLARHTGKRDDGYPVTQVSLRLEDLKEVVATSVTVEDLEMIIEDVKCHDDTGDPGDIGYNAALENLLSAVKTLIETRRG